MFQYLIDRIQAAPFSAEPFRYLYIEDFFQPEHFELLRKDQQLDLPVTDTVEDLIDLLSQQHYTPEPFPGCTTNIDHYLRWFHGDRGEKFESDLLEGFGIAFRMRSYHSRFTQLLIDFLNGDQFHGAIKQKFSRVGNTRVETAIQKYLSGYEISPHPDIRKKCLTYMININPSDQSDVLDIHTHVLEFRQQYQHIYQYWQNNQDIDRCWVPWDWCQTRWQHRANNSILMFAPGDDTLHAVKLDYDHLATQRTQIYGNLWYGKGSNPPVRRADWRQLPKDMA